MGNRAFIKYNLIILLFASIAWLSLNASPLENAQPKAPREPQKEQQIKKLVEVSDDQKNITLPLRIFIIKDLSLNKRGVTMTTWITPEQIEEIIIPEINRIWKPAGIQWVIESINIQNSVDLPTKQQHIEYVQNSVREPKDSKNRRFPDRTKKIKELCGDKNNHPRMQNLYFFPYVGQTYQGFANLRGNNAYLGVYSDKHTKGIKPPEKVLLIEKLPMKRGSLGRTAAHELGHNLGLEHPIKTSQKVFNRIMGGRKQGYNLTPEEITKARAIALKRAKKILAP